MMQRNEFLINKNIVIRIAEKEERDFMDKMKKY